MKSFARTLSGIVILIFLFSQSVVYAFTTDLNTLLEKDIILFVGSPKAYFYNYETQIDTDNIKVCPFVRSGRTLIPVRFISEKLGAVVDFQKTESKVIIKYKVKTISFVIGKNEIDVDGLITQIDTAAMVENGRTYIPLRALVEALDKSVFWDESGLIVIGDKENVPASLGQSQLKELKGKFQAVGNIPGYIVNYINYARQGDWIYYNGPGGLYKSETDGSRATKLADGSCQYINVLGEWVYASTTGTSGLGIYKIKTDGTQKIKLNSDNADYINVVGDWIYYVNTSNATKPWKMKTDGTHRQRINDYPMACLSVVDDWIYFENAIDENCVYKMKTDGSQMKKLTNYGDYRTKHNVIGDWIYLNEGYYDHNKDFVCGLFKVRTDGTLEEQLDDGVVGDIIVIDDWIYYTIYKEALYRIKIDGTGKQILYKGDISGFRITDDWIYFCIWDENYNIKNIKVKTDGSQNELVP